MSCCSLRGLLKSSSRLAGHGWPMASKQLEDQLHICSRPCCVVTHPSVTTLGVRMACACPHHKMYWHMKAVAAAGSAHGCCSPACACACILMHWPDSWRYACACSHMHEVHDASAQPHHRCTFAGSSSSPMVYSLTARISLLELTWCFLDLPAPTVKEKQAAFRSLSHNSHHACGASMLMYAGPAIGNCWLHTGCTQCLHA